MYTLNFPGQCNTVFCVSGTYDFLKYCTYDYIALA